MKAIRTGPHYGRSPIDELAARHDYVSVRLIEALVRRLAATFRAWRDAAPTGRAACEGGHSKTLDVMTGLHAEECRRQGGRGCEMIFMNDSRPEYAEIMRQVRLARAQAAADTRAAVGSALARLGRGLWRGALGTAAAIGRWRRERATVRELMALDDYLLKDIGLSRSMIRGVAAGIARTKEPQRAVPVPAAVADDHAAALAAHRLRTPLTAIRSFSEILRDNPGLAPEQRDAFLGIVIDESERLDRAIDTVDGPRCA